jgi:hypothetical protein
LDHRRLGSSGVWRPQSVNHALHGTPRYPVPCSRVSFWNSTRTTNVEGGSSEACYRRVLSVRLLPTSPKYVRVYLSTPRGRGGLKSGELMDIGAVCRSAGMTSGFTTVYRKNRWYQAQTIPHATSDTILTCPKRLSHRPLVFPEVNSCRRRLRLFVLETFDDRTLDVDPI